MSLHLIELLIGSTTLSLRNVTRDDGGDYECVADNGVSPTDKHSMKLDVKCKEINSEFITISFRLKMVRLGDEVCRY